MVVWRHEQVPHTCRFTLVNHIHTSPLPRGYPVSCLYSLQEGQPRQPHRQSEEAQGGEAGEGGWELCGRVGRWAGVPSAGGASCCQRLSEPSLDSIHTS
jgi:hypothetical protein